MEWAVKVLALDFFVDSAVLTKTEKRDTTEITTGDSNNAIHEDHFHQRHIGIGQQSGAVGNNSILTRLPRYPAAGRYADLTDLAQKLRTLAFNISDYHGVDPVISKVNPPTLTLTLQVSDFHRSQLQCFAGSEVLSPNWLNDSTFTVSATKAVGKGRSRYNCTAPSLSKKGYYYWYSQPWLN